MSADGRPAGPPRLEIPAWTPPYPASEPTFVRLSPTHLREDGCAEQIARKARPDLWLDDRGPREPAPVGSFALGLVRDVVLDLLNQPIPDPHPSAAETPGTPVTAMIRQRMDEAWESWDPQTVPVVEAAVLGYLDILDSLRADGSLYFTRTYPHLVALQDPDGDRVEWWVWAIHHINGDGSAREVHLLRWRDAKHALLPEAEAAFIACVSATGVIAEHERWYHPFDPRPAAMDVPSERIRVRMIGLLDGSTDVRFDGTPEEAVESARQLVSSRLGMLAGGSHRPGSGCATCNVRQACPGLRRMPGLLGVTGYSPRTRAVTPSDLWTHRACPRQLYLARDLALPRTPVDDGPGLTRGTQVHAWLAAAHARGPACSPADLPESVDADAVHRALGWSAEEYATNRPYLVQHLGQCPLDAADATDLTTELSVTAWDTDANLVFTTRPDAAWRRGDGRWVLRETKTLSPRGLPEDRTQLLERYPQIAASICLLADGYTPDGLPPEQPGVVELELLGPDAGALLEYDASDPVVVLVARTALADRIDAWLFDTEHPVGAHPPCRSCAVLRWCGARPMQEADEGQAVAHPPAGGHDWAATDAVLAQVSAAEQVEEFPF